ncbi:MAG: hypothetical protein Q9222_005733, partial [Ikaeria aurantiellina]
MGADKRKSMRERTSELEGMITQILTKLDSNPTATRPQDAETKAAEALRSLRTELLPSTTLGADVLAQHHSPRLASPMSEPEESGTANDNSRHFTNPPLLSLFDNSVLAKGNEQHELSNGELSSHVTVTDKHRRVLSALKSLRPSIGAIGVILRASRQSLRQWQDALRDCMGPAVEEVDQDEFQTTQEFIHRSLQSDSIPVVAQTFACLALTMQQLPGTFDFSTLHLPASPDALQDHYITAVETLMASDDGLASTLEGMSCLLVQTKYYVNLGKPRKGWLTIRRALNFAQMLGFHRLSYTQNDPTLITRRSIWLTIFQVERYLSLLLGYPSACLDAYVEGLFTDQIADGRLDRERFVAKIGIITGQIISRNQDPQKMTIAATLKIDQDLEDTRNMMPAPWRGPDSDLPEADVYEKSIMIAFLHNVRILAHLPFMLKSNTDRRCEYSRIAALESSRQMIENYHCVRHPARPLVAVCGVFDFQVFTAAMLLIINLLGRSDSVNETDIHEDSKDWSLIDGFIADLQLVAKGISSYGSNTVAKQALTVLEDLMKARDCTDGAGAG